MIKLLTLNIICLTYTAYAISVSWAAFYIVPIALFGGSIFLLSIHRSRIGNWVLYTMNCVFATLGIMVVAVSFIGGLVYVGPGASAVLILLFPLSIIVANALQGRKAVLSGVYTNLPSCQN